MTKEEKLLGWVSFLVLMNEDGSYMGKSAKYIEEKVLFFNTGYHMYMRLHPSLRGQVLAWGKKWGVDFENVIRRYEK